ncbi:MAG: sugar phosphate isomerase/epimerase, partial [Spirosoma sp.]|nr:sugar phosphate isomerase/epimerase [Spirosoma sp.]
MPALAGSTWLRQLLTTFLLLNCHEVKFNVLPLIRVYLVNSLTTVAMTRRDALRYSLGAALAAQAYPGQSAVQIPNARFKIGACDWSIGPAGDINAFAKAKRIGLDGVQVSLNTATDHEHLRRPEVQQAHKEAAKQAGVSFGGLAIGLLNEIPYK